MGKKRREQPEKREEKKRQERFKKLNNDEEWPDLDIGSQMKKHFSHKIHQHIHET